MVTTMYLQGVHSSSAHRRRSIGELRRRRDQMLPEVATTGHVHKGPERRTGLQGPKFGGKRIKQTNPILQQKTKRRKKQLNKEITSSRRGDLGERVAFVFGILNEVVVGVGDVLLRGLGFEVSEDEKAGESGGEEYQNQPQRTHFLNPTRRKERGRED